MSRTRFMVFLTVILALAALHPVFAQDALALDKTFTSDDGLVSFSYPADWVIGSADTDGLILNISVGTSKAALDKDVVGSSSTGYAPGEVRVNIIMAKRADFTGLLNISADASPADVVRAITRQTHADNATFGAISKTTGSDHPGAQATFSASEQRGDGFVRLMEYDDDVIGGAAVYTAAGELEQWQPTADAVLASLTYAAPSQPTPPPATAVPGTALALSETYTTSSNSVTFNYPSGWIVTDTHDMTSILDAAVSSSDAADKKNLGTSDAFEPGEVKVQLLIVEQNDLLSNMDGLDADSTPMDILNALQNQSTPPQGITMSDATATSLHDLPGAQMQITAGTSGDGRIVLIRYRPGLLLLMAVFTAPGELPQWDATARAMLESVVIRQDDVTPTPVGTPVS